MFDHLPSTSVRRLARRPLSAPCLATVAAATALATSGLGLAYGLDEPEYTFAELAPANTSVVMAMDNMAESMKSLHATSLGDLWRSDQMQSFMTRPFETFREEMNAEFGLDWGIEDLPMPQGPAGVAMYHLDSPDAEEGDPLQFGALVVMDFGDEIDRTLEWFDASLDGLEDDEYDIETFEDRTIYVMDLYDEAAAEMEDAAFEAEFQDDPDFDDEMWDDEFSTEPPFMLPFEEGEMFITFDGSIMLVTSDLRTMEDTILLLDGHDAPTLADNAMFNAARNAAGTEGDMFFAVLLDELLNVDTLAEVLAIDPMMIEPFETIGLTDLDAFAGWLNMGREPGTLLDSRYVLYMEDGFGGLWTLATTSDGGFTVPTWADPEVASAMMFNIDFGEVVPLIRTMIKSMPPDVSQQASDAFESTAAELMSVVLGELGPEIYAFSWPATEEELKEGLTGKSMFAVACRDELTVENGIAPWAGMLGMKPRDFLGYRIYDFTDPSGMLSAAIGFGKGHVFIGESEPVEQALRATDDTPGLAQDDAFRDAIQGMPPGAMGYTYTAMRPRVEMMLAAAALPFDEAYQQEMLDELRVMFEDAGLEFDEDLFREEPPDWYTPDTLPTADFLMRYLGDSISRVEITDQGFVIEAQWLVPTPK